MPDQVHTATSTTALTPALAQRIAGETSAIVGYNILITDTTGVVIGSGDTSRVGSFHEASVDVVRTRQPASHSAAQARALRGVRPGVTLPILLDGQAVGTVGITGTPGQVTRFGLMVERQTEILLNEALQLRSRMLRERVLEELIRDIASFDPELVDAEPILDRAREQALDLAIDRRVLVFEVADRSMASDALMPSAVRLIREVFADPQSVAVAGAPDRFVVLARVARTSDDGMRQLAVGCLDQLTNRLGMQILAGIGPSANTLAGLRDSYTDAVDAVRLGARRSGMKMVAVERVRAAQLIANVGHRARARYVLSVASRLTAQPDWRTLRETVVAWCDSGFSLVRAADALAIHRNTLVYRLEKIEQLQGWTCRSGRDYIALYLACIADQVEH